MARAKQSKLKTYQVGDDMGAIKQLANLIRLQVEKSLRDSNTRRLANSIVASSYTYVKDPRSGLTTPCVEYYGRFYPVAYPGHKAPNPCYQRDFACEVQAIWNFIALNIRYTADIDGSDTYQDLRTSLETGAGDCDDATIGLCSLLRAVGFECAARIISLNGDSWDHVYPLVKVPGIGWVPLDVTEPAKLPGWEQGSRRGEAKPADVIDFMMGEGEDT